MINKITKREADKQKRLRKQFPRFNDGGKLYFNIEKDWYECTTPGALGLKEIWHFRKRNTVENMNLFDSDKT